MTKAKCTQCGAMGIAGHECEYCGAMIPLTPKKTTKKTTPSTTGNAPKKFVWQNVCPQGYELDFGKVVGKMAYSEFMVVKHTEIRMRTKRVEVGYEYFGDLKLPRYEDKYEYNNEYTYAIINRAGKFVVNASTAEPILFAEYNTYMKGDGLFNLVTGEKAPFNVHHWESEKMRYEYFYVKDEDRGCSSFYDMKTNQLISLDHKIPVDYRMSEKGGTDETFVFTHCKTKDRCIVRIVANKGVVTFEKAEQPVQEETKDKAVSSTPQSNSPAPKAVKTPKKGKSSCGCGCITMFLIALLCAGMFFYFVGTSSNHSDLSTDDLDTTSVSVDTVGEKAAKIKEWKRRDANECDEIIYVLSHCLEDIKTFSGGKSCRLRKEPISYREYDAVVYGYFCDDETRYDPIEDGYALFSPAEIRTFFKCLNKKTKGKFRLMTRREGMDVHDNLIFREVYDKKRNETTLVVVDGTQCYSDDVCLSIKSMDNDRRYYFRIATDWEDDDDVVVDTI